MELFINGELIDAENAETLLDLIKQLNIKSEQVVVEHNGNIPLKTQWEEVFLKPGDHLEIVRFMGGG